MSQNSISLPNPLAFFGLFQKFQNNEIGGLTFYNLKCYEVFIHFFYLSLLQNPKALIINKDNKTKSFIDDNFQICISMKNSFKKPISSYLKDKKYIKNLFLIEPRILLNIKMPKTELLNLIDMKIFFKKIDKLTNINQIMAFKKFPNVCKTLIKKSHNELISEFIKNIQNERNFYEFYKEFAKPIIFFANILTKINFGIKIKDFKDNDNLLKIIMNCF